MTNKKITITDLAEVITLLVKRFDKFEQRLDKLEQRFDKLEQRFDKLEQRFDRLEQRVGKLEQRFDKLEIKVDTLETTMQSKFDTFETTMKNGFKKAQDETEDLAAMIQRQFIETQNSMDEKFESTEERFCYMQRDISELKYGQVEIKGMFKTKTDTKDFEAFKKKCKPLFSIKLTP